MLVLDVLKKNGFKLVMNTNIYKRIPNDKYNLIINDK